MGNGNPTSGHTNHNLTVATATNVDGLGDGDHILSPTLTNMVEGIHGNGVIMYDDTSGGEGDRNIPANIPGAVNYASGTTFTVKGGYAVLDGIMYEFAGGVGATTTYTLNTSSASAAGSPTALTSGTEALVVVYVSADNTSTVKNIYWELGTATPVGTNSYPATPTSFLNIPIATGTASENYLSNTQTVVLAVLRVAFASGGDDLKLVITEVNDKRVFIRPSPMYFSPVTSGDVASTDELLDLDAFHSGIGNGALGASRFGAMWQSFGAAVTGSTVPDDNKDVLYYSGTHAARYTRSVFDRVLTSADATITIKSTDANALILTPTASTNVITNGSFPAGYIIYIRNLDTDDYVRFALTSSASSTMASYYEIAPATFASFICTTSHASYPTFALLFDDTIDTPQIAADAVTSAKIADGAVDTEHIAADAIEEEQIGAGEVKTAAIANSNVTLAKIANIADDRVLGNISGSAAAPAELTAANLRTLLGVADGSLTTNDFTDADHSKLDAIEASATADQTDAEIRAAVEAATDSNVFTDADHSKLNGIEASATADQTDAEIRAAVEAATDSNVFTDADHSKLNGIEASADVTDTTNVVAALTAGTNVAIAGDGTISATDTNTEYTVGDGGLTQRNFTTTLKNKLDAIEASATADQTDAEIRAAVEAATDSNVFTDADHTKLNGIAASATAYADSDAISAVEGEATLALSGSVTVATGQTFVSPRLPAVTSVSGTLSEGTHAGRYNICSGGVTLPSSSTAGEHYTILNTTSGDITVARNGNNINGAGSDITVATYNAVTCIGIGSNNWIALGV